MATGVQPSKFINYISQFKKVLVTRNNGVITQTFKIDSSIDDNYYFSIVNSNNQLISLEGRVFRIYGSLIDTKEQMHILFYSDRCTIENGTQMHFKIETYTSQYMNWVKSKRIIDLTIVEVANPDAPEEEQTTQVVLRDEAIAYKRPYIENQTPTEILQKVILTTNVPLTGAFGSGHDIDLTIGSDGAAFGTGLTQTGDNQLVIGQYNEADATKAFVIGNGEDNSNRSNVFTVDYQGNVEAKSITVDGQDVGDKVNQLENTIEAVSAAIPSVEGFATEDWVQDQGYLTAHQSLDGYATEQWVLNKGYITGVNLDPYATKDQLTAYATKTDLTVSASVLSNQISQLALDIPTKVSDLTNDAGYLTAVPTSYALKTDIPTGNAQLQNTAGYITGYNAGTGISISNGTISLTGEVGKTYYADNNTLQLNNNTNTFSIKSLSSKLNQGANILLTPQSDGSVTINAIGGGGGGTGGATYLAGLGLSLSTVSAEDGIYKFYVNEPWLDNKIDTATSGIQNLSAGTGLKIEDNVISLTAQIPSIDGLASEQWVETNFLSAIPSNYATKDYVDSSVSGKADLSSVYTKEEVYTYIETDVKILAATSGKADKSEVQAVDNKFANYYTSAQVDQAIADAVEDIPSTVYTGEDGIKVENGVISLTATIPTAISDLTNDSEFATSAQVRSIVEGYGYITDAALADYAQLSDIPTGNAQLQNTAQYITSADIPTSYVQQSELESVSGQLTNAIGAKANSADVEAEFTATSAWANGKFLTEHQSLDNYYNKTQVDTALALKADSADVYTKTEVNTISSNIVSQIPTDVATSAYVQAASGNAVSVATGWVQDKNYLTEVPSEYITETELATELEPYAQTTDVTTAITNATSGKADKTYVDSTFLSASQIADYYTSAQVETRISAETSGKVNKKDFDTVTGALSTAIDSKTTSGEVKTQIQAYGYQTATDVANAISGKADKSELQSVSGTLNTAIGAVDTKADTNTNSINALTGRVKAIEDDYTTSAYVTGQVNNLAIGAVATNTTNIGQLSTKLDTVSSSVPTSVYQIATAGSGITISEQGEIALIWNTIPSAVSQLINDVGFVTETGGGGTGIEYYGGYGISVNGAEISLTADIPTNTNQLTNGAGFISAIALWFDGESDAQNVTDITFTSDFTWNSGDIGINAQGIIAANEIATESYVDGQVSGKADQSTVETLSTALSAAITGVANNIPLSTSQLTNDSGFITASDIPAAPSTVYDKLSAGSNITLTKNDQTGVTTIAATGGGASTISVTVEDRSTEQLITAPVSSVYFTENGFKGDISNNVANIQWKGIFGLDSNEELIDYEKGIQWSEDFSVGTSEDHFTVALTNPIPTNTSDLTNDSNFATSTYVQTASGNAVSVATGWVQDKNYLTAHQSLDGYATEQWVESKHYLTGIDLSDYATEEYVDTVSGNIISQIPDVTGYATKTELSNTSTAIVAQIPNLNGYATESYVQTEIGKIDIPTNVSDLTNDSGYQNAAQVSAIASAYAQGGGGGTTYTAGTGIDITNDEISVKLSGGDNVTLSTDSTGLVTINATGGGGSTNLIAGNKIRLTETPQGTRIDVLDYKVSASNQTFDFDWRNGVETSALVYQYEGDYPIQATFNPVLPNGITFNNGIFTATSGATVTNGTSVISTTIFTEDAVEKTIETTFNTIGFINAEISASTITSFVFDANNAETISAFTWNVVSGTPQNLTVEISGTLPNGVTSALSIQNRTLTLSAASEELMQNETKTVNVVFDGDNIERQVIALELTVQNIVVRDPLTFTGKSASNAVQLSAVGDPDPITLKYSKNGGAWTNYNIGDIIEFGNEESVAFEGNNDHFCKSTGNAYKFVMTGTIEANGNIQSLMNYSNTVLEYCYFALFQGCSSLITAPSFPVTTLAKGCYRNVFQNCTSLTAAPELPATELVNSCYMYMFYNCPALRSIEVGFTDWKANIEATWDWTSSTPSDGTFTKPAALPETRGGSYIPANWTVVNK